MHWWAWGVKRLHSRETESVKLLSQMFQIMKKGRQALEMSVLHQRRSMLWHFIQGSFLKWQFLISDITSGIWERGTWEDFFFSSHKLKFRKPYTRNENCSTWLHLFNCLLSSTFKTRCLSLVKWTNSFRNKIPVMLILLWTIWLSYKGLTMLICPAKTEKVTGNSASKKWRLLTSCLLNCCIITLTMVLYTVASLWFDSVQINALKQTHIIVSMWQSQTLKKKNARYFHEEPV